MAFYTAPLVGEGVLPLGVTYELDLENTEKQKIRMEKTFCIVLCIDLH